MKYRIYGFIAVSLMIFFTFQNCGKLESTQSLQSASQLSLDFTMLTSPSAFSKFNEFTFKNLPENKTISCQLDSEVIVECSSPLQLNDIEEGSHQLQIFADDEILYEYEWVYDKTQPEVIVKTSGVETETTFIFDYESLDNLTTAEHLKVECAFDNKKLSDCASPIFLEEIAQGEHSLELKITDLAGNQSLISHPWTQEGGEWILSFSNNLPSLRNTTNADFVFQAKEVAAPENFANKFLCELDEAPAVDCGRDLGSGYYLQSYEDITEGKHELKITALSANDTAITSIATEWVVDLTPPATQILEPVPERIETVSVEVKFKATDKSGIASYWCDGPQPTGGCQPPFIYASNVSNGFSPGIQRVGIEAIDSAGNHSERVFVDLNFVIPKAYGGSPEGSPINIQKVGNKAYVLFGNGIAVFDISNLQTPTLNRFINTDQFRQYGNGVNSNFFIANDLAYVVPTGMVLDIKDPERVVHVSSLNNFYSGDFYKIGNRLAIVSSQRLELYQIDNNRPVFKVQRLPGFEYEAYNKLSSTSWARSKNSIISLRATEESLETVDINIFDIVSQPKATQTKNFELPVVDTGEFTYRYPHMDMRASDDYIIVSQDLMPTGSQYPDHPKLQFRVFDTENLTQLTETNSFDINNEIKDREFEISNDLLVTRHISLATHNPWVGIYDLKDNFKQLSTITDIEWDTHNGAKRANDITASGNYLFINYGTVPNYTSYDLTNPANIIKGGAMPGN